MTRLEPALLGRVIGSGSHRMNGVENLEPGTLLEAAQAEGVLGLVHEALFRVGSRHLATETEPALQSEVLTGMLIEKTQRDVLGVLAALGVPALLLKGSALAHWAYDQPHLRACSDVDILLPSRAAAEALSSRLTAEGYRRATTSGDMVAYELLCTRQVTPDWAVEIDVHWRLSNSALHADRFTFDELMAASVAIPSLGPNARGLGPVHATVHAAMHRASNIEIGVGDRLKWLYDFVVLEKHLGPSDWAQLVALARERQLAGVTLSALEAASAMFGTVFPEDVLASLRLAAQSEPLDASRLNDWAYMQAQTVRALPGWGPKLRWLWQRVFPSRDYMACLYGDQGSYGGLLRERAKRAWRKWRG